MSCSIRVSLSYVAMVTAGGHLTFSLLGKCSRGDGE